MLTQTYKRALVDPERRESFDDIKTSFLKEKETLANLRYPYLLDRFHLNAVIDNRKELLELSKLIERLKDKIRYLKKNKG